MMLAFAPPDKAIEARPWLVNYEPDATARIQRYAVIARDIAHVVNQPENKPPAGFSKVDAAALLAAIAIGESGLDPDVDLGPCYRGGVYRYRCDAGHSASMWQLQVPPKERAKLFGNRRYAAKRALKGLRWSLGRCAREGYPEQYWLSAYGAGHCGEHKGAAQRWKLFRVLNAFEPRLRPAAE